MRQHVWLLVCGLALAAGKPNTYAGTDVLPQNDYSIDLALCDVYGGEVCNNASTTTTSSSSSDSVLCELYGGDECKNVKPTTTTTTTTTSTTISSVDIPASGSGTNPDGCECVPVHLCDDNNVIIEDGRGLLDIRLRDPVCDTYNQKCCLPPNIQPPEKPISAFIPPTTPPSLLPARNMCGVRNTDGVGFRITGDVYNEAQYGEFPWMVAVVQTTEKNGKSANVYRCGGSLIHPQVVLTGAHCVRGRDNLVIRVGEWDTQTQNEVYPTQDAKVRETVIHEQFNNYTLINDPALLILDTPVDITIPNVGLICLPEEGENMDGRDCVASGWGKDQYGKEGKYQVIMKKVEIPIVPREPCLEALRQTRLGRHFKLHSSFICAGGQPGKDTCKGDGGGPLACPSKGNPGVYVQAGIVAWGIGCGTETPGVYVNVPAFVSWIRNQAGQHGFEIA